MRVWPSFLFSILLVWLAAILTGCASPRTVETREMVATAYCPCGQCNGYYRGTWKFLKMDRWNRRVNYGSRKGQPYTGRTASGDTLKTTQAGLLSVDSARRPWMIPVRIALFPWKLAPRDGTIAADTDYYPFGTVMIVPGWGRGTVQDRGGAIKGPDRIDLFHRTHGQALRWGRQRVAVEIVRGE